MAVNTSRAHPSKELPGGLVAVPFSAMTAITTVDTFVSQLTVTNTTAGALTITVQDGSGNKLLNAVSIAANTTMNPPLVWPDLVLMTGGVKWQASATGLVAELFGYQRGA
jgi:hypothetical protein